MKFRNITILLLTFLSTIFLDAQELPPVQNYTTEDYSNLLNGRLPSSSLEFELADMVIDLKKQLTIHSVVKSSCNCYADQWDKREDNTIYCTGCGKDV